MESAADASEIGHPSRERARHLARPLLSVAAIVAIVVGLYLSAAGMSGDGPRVAVLPTPEQVPLELLPPTAAGLDLSSSLTGQGAVDTITSLHVTGFAVSWAEVAWYANGRVTVWVARGPADGPDASKLADRMAARIRAHDASPFTAPKSVPEAEGVWRTEGFDQVHFFFARDGAVWWVSADPGLGRDALSGLLGAAR
jgi:hypothetical protein